MRGTKAESGMHEGGHGGVFRGPLDKGWDDEGVIPEDLSPDTDYLFTRMTRETLRAVGASPGDRVLDVGCGRGLDLALQGPKGAVLFGLDGSHVMIRKAASTFQERGLPALLVCAAAEGLPFPDATFHKVYCKGAIDHFYDPGRAVREMARVLRPGGRLVISVANFESLGCRLGRFYNRVHKVLRGRELPRPHFWEIPADHRFKFDHPLSLGLLPHELRLHEDLGISLLWGFPHWGQILRALPKGLARGCLRGLDLVAKRIPSLADVVVITAIKSGEAACASDEKRMEKEGGKEMKSYSRVQGIVLCLITVLAAVLFLVGLAMESYWAVAIPVAIGFLWLLGLGFWIGWTLVTIKVEPDRD